MANWRRLLCGLIGLGLLLGLNAPLPAAAAPSRRAPPDAPEMPEGYQPVAENEWFQLWLNETTLGFKVLDRRSDYVWDATLDRPAATDRLNKTWRAFAASGVTLEYLDQKAVAKRASITNSNHALVVQPIERGVSATLTFSDVAISLTVNLRLEPYGVSVEVPFESIHQDGDFKLGTLHLFPFMAATRADSVPGYMFIPDGSGALIPFVAQTKARNMFYGRYYGKDLGMLAALPWDRHVNPAFPMSIPVVGMVHGPGQNAYLVVVEKGAAYGEIQAHPSGIITNFNFLYNAFIYNESYFQATNRSGAGVTAIQPATNAFDVRLQYRFLAGADSDYVGLARSYQQYLVEKGVLRKTVDPDDAIGIRLEFLGGEKEKVLFWQRLIPMTTVDQMAAILKDLNVQDPEVVYYGWQPLGAAAMPPTTLRLEPGLGSLDQLRALAQTVAATGGHFSLYLDPQAAFEKEGGYSPRNDLALAITDANLEGYNRGKPNYFFNAAAVSRRYTSLSADVFSRLEATGLALDGVGSTAYSDFRRGSFLNREQAIAAYQSLFDGSAGRLAFYRPNDYLFGQMSAYYDMPATGSGYLFTSEAVPFLPIVLAGYVPYYGSALNFSPSLQDDLLRQADFGTYPSFFLSADVTARILLTSSQWIYTSSYDQWKQPVQQAYQWLNQLLGPVKGQPIIARQTLSDGVVATTYGNGRRIIVNYTDRPYSGLGVTVSPKDAVLTEVQP